VSEIQAGRFPDERTGYHKSKGDAAMREVIIRRGEDSFWVAECPSLPGCISQADTRDKAILNIKEAIALYIEALEEDGLSVPEELFETLVVAV
jgi:predicted RNase H-like HicB family nuclease